MSEPEKEPKYTPEHVGGWRGLDVGEKIVVLFVAGCVVAKIIVLIYW